MSKFFTMKYVCLTFLLMLPFVPLCAQNWMPLIAGETQHYRLGNAQHITHSLRIDSVKLAGGDTVFYLNRVLERVLFPLAPGDSLFVPFPGQGQFLGQTMVRKPDGSLVLAAERILFDTTIILRPWDDPGSSWLAVPESQMMATVLSVTEDLVLGEADSLKTIQFDNGVHWVLSRRHGLVSCPDPNGAGTIHLSGLEKKQLGDRLYRFDDFFDFQVGDVFEYSGYVFSLSGSTNFTEQYTILEKLADPEKNAYFAEYRWHRLRQGGNPGLTVGIDTVWWTFNRSDYANIATFPRQLIPIANHYFLGQNVFSETRYFENGLRLGSPFFQYPDNENEGYCAVLWEQSGTDPALEPFLDALECTGQSYFEEFTLGLGRTAYHIGIIDNTISEYLRGAVIQGDTVGEISPDWLFSGVKTPVLDQQAFAAYPNPAYDRITIRPASDRYQPLWITLHDALGREVRRFGAQNSNAGTVLDLAGLPGGMHFIRVQCAAGIWTEKFFIRGSKG